MKRIILLCSLIALALSTQAQSTGTWNKVVAKDTLWLSGRGLAEVVYSILATSKNNEVPTAKAVYDYVQAQIVAVPLTETQIGFGDASNFLTSSPDLTYDGDFLHVVGDVDIEHENCAVVIDDIAPSGISQGGTLYLNSKDGAALANGDRIGGLSFIGSTGVGGTNSGATIDVFTDGAWSGTESPGEILFSTTQAGDLNLVPNMRVRQTGNWELLSGREFRYFDTDGSNYIGFKAPALTTNQTWTLPSDAPANGEVLTWTTGNLLTWETPASGGTFYQTWKRDGTAATQRANADFKNTTDINITLTDNGGTSATDVTFDIPDGAIDLSEMANISTSVLLGNANVSPGPPLEISLGSQFEINGVTLTLDQNSAVTNNAMVWDGSVWEPGAINLNSANAVTGDLPFSNVAQLAGLSVLGRSANTTGDMAAITGTVQTVPMVQGTALDFHPIPSKTFFTTVTLPTTALATEMIGVLSHQEAGRTAFVEIDVIIAVSGISCLRKYIYPLTFNHTQNGSWVRLAPFFSNGAYSTQDFELEVKNCCSGSTPTYAYDTLRLVRTSGAVSGTGDVVIQYYGHNVDANTFTAMSESGTSASPGMHTGQAFAQVKQAIGINTPNPAATLDIKTTDNSSSSNAVTVDNSALARMLTLRNDGHLGIGNNGPTQELHVTGNARLTGAFYDSNNEAGTSGQLLSSTATGTDWITASGSSDHGALTGLGDDDHAQYLLLAGRSGGQVATGGTGSGDDITIRSTTNATKGDVILNDQGGNVIIGGAATASEQRFMEPSGGGTNYTGFKAGALAGNQLYTLPTDAPADGQILTYNSGDLLSWEDPGGGAAFYQTLQIGGVDQTQRGKLNISPTAQINVSYSDDAGGNRSNVEFSIANDAIGTDEIDDASILTTDLNQNGASTTQALIWNGSSWNAQYIEQDQTISDLSADADNWNPTNWATRTMFTVGSDATIRAITGFTALPGGTERTIVNSSAFPIYVPCNHPDSDNGNRVIGPADYIIPPYGGNLTIVYSNNFSKWQVKSCTFDPAKLGNAQPGQFFNQMPGSTNQSDHSFLGLAVSGTNAGQSNAPSTTSLPQSWELTSGTTAAGVATIYFPKNVNNWTAYGSSHITTSAWVYITALSTSAQRFTTLFGFVSNANSTSATANNQVGIRYSDNINGGDWEFFTRNNSGTETTVDCNVAVATNTMYLLTVSVDKARSEARCYINGTMIGTITTNLPNAVVCGTRMLQGANVGTSNKLSYLASISGWSAY